MVGEELAECGNDLVEQDWLGGVVDGVDKGEDAVAAVGDRSRWRRRMPAERSAWSNSS